MTNMLLRTRMLCMGSNLSPTSGAVPWKKATIRFFGELQQLDSLLASNDPLGLTAQQLLQGPLAEVLTDIGEITIIRCFVGIPEPQENCFAEDFTPDTNLIIANYEQQQIRFKAWRFFDADSQLNK